MFGNGAKIITTLCPKTENRVIFNILYCSCKSFAMKFSVWYPDDIKRVHNLLPHLTYVFTLPDITQKPKSYVVFLSIAWVALKRTSLGVSEVAVIRAGCWLNHSRCSKWRPFVFTLWTQPCLPLCGQWLRRWCREEYHPIWPHFVDEPQLQLVNVAFQFLCNFR